MPAKLCSDEDLFDLDKIETKINKVIPKLHALSIGSGLGDDEYMGQSVQRVIKRARELQLPMVLDAVSAIYK